MSWLFNRPITIGHFVRSTLIALGAHLPTYNDIVRDILNMKYIIVTAHHKTE